MACYLFTWYDGSKMTYQKAVDSCLLNNMQPSAIDAVQKFTPVFSAVGHKNFALLSGYSNNSGSMNVFTYTRIWLNRIFHQKTVNIKEAKGYIVCQSKPKEPVKFRNTFMCSDKSSVSSSFICDGVNDCNVNINAVHSCDELGCTCKSLNNNCKEICNGSDCFCSPLYYKSKYRNCLSYRSKTTQVKVSNKVNQNGFICNDNTTIDIFLKDDSVPDCTVNAEDEPLLKSLLTNNTLMKCQTPASIPCITGSSICYKISDICVYRLDNLNNLHPCRTGSHMEECEEFECNQHYKCPGYYCIPWGYVCDGKLDCPFGSDELPYHNCVSTRQCKNV